VPQWNSNLNSNRVLKTLGGTPLQVIEENLNHVSWHIASRQVM